MSARTLAPLRTVALILAACGPSEPPVPPTTKPPDVVPPKACTQEAKLCPDGTAVSRTGPQCEFAPCPSPAADAGSKPALTPNTKP